METVLKTMIGDLIVQLASLKSQLDAANARIVELEATKD